MRKRIISLLTLVILTISLMSAFAFPAFALDVECPLSPDGYHKLPYCFGNCEYCNEFFVAHQLTGYGGYEDGHYKRCTVCKDYFDGEPHDGEYCFSPCSVCGYKNICDLSYNDMEYDDTYHYIACTKCDYSYCEDHILSAKEKDQTSHTVFCLDCDYKSEQPHTYINDTDSVCADCGAERQEEWSWSYNPGSGALTISGFGALPDFEPRTAPWMEYQYNICAINIDEGITHIGKWAFSYLYNARSVKLPDSLEYIGTSAFYYCSSLEEVLIPESVTGISNGAFSYCKNLTSVSYPKNITKIPLYCFYDCNKLTNIYYAGNSSNWNALSVLEGNDIVSDSIVKLNTKAGTTWAYSDGTLTIGGYGRMKNYDAKTAPWYEYATDIKNIVVEEGVTGIGNWAFAYCFNVKQIDLPDSLVHIGSGAFYKCTSIKNLDIPENVTRIFSGAFYSCSKLTDIILPVGIDTLYANTFMSCSALENVSFRGTKVQWQKINVLQNNTELSTIQMNYLVKSIEWSIDEEGILTITGNCKMDDYELNKAPYAPWSDVKEQIKKVVIENGIPNIGKNAFYGCSNLTEIVIPESVTYVGYGAFFNCYALKEVNLPDTVDYIGAGAFYNNLVLENLTIPSGVKNIYSNTFYGCSKLKSVIYKGNIDELMVALTGNNYFINAIS